MLPSMSTASLVSSPGLPDLVQLKSSIFVAMQWCPFQGTPFLTPDGSTSHVFQALY